MGYSRCRRVVLTGHWQATPAVFLNSPPRAERNLLLVEIERKAQCQSCSLITYFSAGRFSARRDIVREVDVEGDGLSQPKAMDDTCSGRKGKVHRVVLSSARVLLTRPETPSMATVWTLDAPWTPLHDDSGLRPSEVGSQFQKRSIVSMGPLHMSYFYTVLRGQVPTGRFFSTTRATMDAWRG
jgi:hypothetical protein